MSSPIIARRLEQQAKVRLLYRRALKTVQSWAVHRDTFYNEAMKTRAEFEQHKNVVSAPFYQNVAEQSKSAIPRTDSSIPKCYAYGYLDHQELAACWL